MEISFVGKRALVTGAGAGVGRAIATALAKGGAIVNALSLVQTELDSLKAEIPDILIHQCDITNYELTRKLVEGLGPIDLLVNNASIFFRKPLLDLTMEDMDGFLDINVKAVLNTSQVVARGLIARNSGGAIVNVASEAGYTASALMGGYGTSKAGMLHLTRMMAVEWGPHQIRANAVLPTLIDVTAMSQKEVDNPAHMAALTARIPQGKIAKVSDVVNSVLYLLSDKSDMVNGSSLFVDGGVAVT